MRNNEHEKVIFDKEGLLDAIRIWRYSAIDLVDIRYKLIDSEETLRDYRMPTSMFLYTSGGKTEVILDNKSYIVERFGIFHGGKGTALSIKPMCKWLEYYIILYRAGEPPFYKREFIKLMEKNDPFKQQYGFSPSNPIFFSEQLKKMYESWKNPEPLDLFFEKASFYQFIYEIYKELEKDDVYIFQQDIVEMAKVYIEKNYNQQISMQEIANILGVSSGHLRTTFKDRYGLSPQEYMISLRIKMVKEYISRSNFKIKEIAKNTGFYDEYQMSKLFKKHEGISPIAYRAKYTSNVFDISIEKEDTLSYNRESLVSIGKHKEEGDFSMFKQIKGRSIIAMVLTMMLLLSACNSTPKGISIQDQEQTMTVQQEKDSKEETKIVHMAYGDVEIPANPKRVVVAFVQGDLLALGITPVGTSFNDDAVFLEKMENVTVIDAYDVNEEEIMALDPDLIIWSNPDAHGTLSKIAPTLAGNFHGMDYRDRLRFFGEVFGVPDKAEQLIKDFENKVEESKKLLKDANLTEKTVILLENQQKGVLKAFGEGRGGDLIYNHLGFPAPERIQKEVIDKEVFSINISYEMLNEYSADYIFSNKNIAELQDNAVFNSLEAVQKGRLIETQTGMFWFSDIMSMNAQLDFIVNSLLESANSFK
ncbi:AraC family transcriptional regulator [Alkaliphilus sp. MSJ-5]|uniref:AraC family transcriptional regulator n=1 Tax=Alkaliphilus flagellatus TaxID=2841507 RepID=A0ABS6G2I4_9FIRM|nr:AraC family transcriptional regulator [Alkaliphilus flagellatus]MBU5675932.1 AraC family transcriptional regulator [Alkaliphilus flagellatus]